MTMDDKTRVHVHTMKIYSAVKNEITEFSGKWVRLEKIITVSQAQEENCCMFFLIRGN